jgi:hypothetical protein
MLAPRYAAQLATHVSTLEIINKQQQTRLAAAAVTLQDEQSHCEQQ